MVVILFWVVFLLFLLCVYSYRKFLAYQTPEEKDEKEGRKNENKKLAMILRQMLDCFEEKYFHYFTGFVLL